MTKLCMGLAALALTASADTLHLINHSFWNGAVTYSDGVFVVRSAEGERTFPAKFVDEVEFNARSSNPGLPPDVPSPRESPGQVKCQAIRTDHTSETGILEKIDGRNVVVRGKTLERGKVESVKIVHD